MQQALHDENFPNMLIYETLTERSRSYSEQRFTEFGTAASVTLWSMY